MTTVKKMTAWAQAMDNKRKKENKYEQKGDQNDVSERTTTGASHDEA